MIGLILLALCLIYVTHVWRRKIKKESSAPPELSGGLPVIGHAWRMIGDRRHAFNVMESISKESLEKGGAVTLRMGPITLYVLSDPEDCLKASNECLDKHYIYDFAKPYIGKGLLVADVPVWKQHRKWVLPAFQQQNLNAFITFFNQQANRLINRLKPEVGKGEFNHDKYIRLTSLESSCCTSFGADVNKNVEIHEHFLNGAGDMLGITTERFQKLWLQSEFIFNMSDLKKRQDNYALKTEEFLSDMLMKRKLEMKEMENGSKNSGQITSLMRYLLELLKETNCCTEKDIVNDCQSITTTGYDTSASTTTLVLMMLGSYPEVQAKTYDEIQEIFGNSMRDVTKEDLSKLVYLEAVIKETLRLYPVVPLVARNLEKDLKLKNYTLKAGNGIGILIWAVHRHAVWGADAEQFRPERWLDGSLPKEVTAFGAFSFGKRACIGRTYATMSMKTVLSHILRHFVISSDVSKIQFEIHTTLRPGRGTKISIEERKINVTSPI